MVTVHLIERSFGSKFSAICNHCGVMAAWSRKTLKYVEECLRCFGKTTPYCYCNFFKILFLWFSLHHRSTSFCSNFVKFVRRKSVKSCVIYLTKTEFRLPLKLSLLCRSRPKYATASPQQCTQSAPESRFYPNRFTFGRVIAERVNTANLPRRVNSIFGGSLASSRIHRQQLIVNRKIKSGLVASRLLPSHDLRSGTQRAYSGSR